MAATPSMMLERMLSSRAIIQSAIAVPSGVPGRDAIVTSARSAAANAFTVSVSRLEAQRAQGIRDIGSVGPAPVACRDGHPAFGVDIAAHHTKHNRAYGLFNPPWVPTCSACGTYGLLALAFEPSCTASGAYGLFESQATTPSQVFTTHHIDTDHEAAQEAAVRAVGEQLADVRETRTCWPSVLAPVSGLGGVAGVECPRDGRGDDGAHQEREAPNLFFANR